MLDKLVDTPALKPLVEAFEEWSAGPVRPVDEAKTPKELIRFLHDEDEGVRLTAAHRLGELEPPADSVVAALRAAADDPVPLVRVYVADAMWKLTGEPDEPVALLVGVLETEQDVGYADETALSKLAGIGPPAKAAIPALENMAQTEERPAMRRQAETVLAYIRKDDTGESS